MSNPKSDGRLPAIPNDIITSSSSQPFIQQDQQDEETSDCPLLTPSPPPDQAQNSLDNPTTFIRRNDSSTLLDQTLNNINSEDGLTFLNIVNSSCKPMHDEPSSRDPMVETSSNSGSSSDTNEPVCTQLLTQLNTAYTHLAPDAQALFYNQENGGKPPLTGIHLVVPKPPKNYNFMSWNWPIIRKTFFWSLMSIFAGCIALAIGVIATMPKRCDPAVEWWQGSLFYEIFPASFEDSYKNDGIGDLRGIINRLDYLDNLGVKGIRLNSIFLSKQYPQQYMNIESLTEVEPTLGTLADFDDLVTAIHKRNMAVILDLPLYPFVKSLGDEIPDSNATRAPNHQKADQVATLIALPSHRKTLETLQIASVEGITNIEGFNVTDNDSTVDFVPSNEVTKAIDFWQKRKVDGFYLKGLEYYTNNTNFVTSLRHFKSILGPNKILMCSEKALSSATGDSRNAILNRMDLVDVILDVANGTRNIKDQVSKIQKGLLFQKAGYPWVHWSTGSVDTPRLASTLQVANASLAVSLMGMMLPGTPSVFYGDEIGLLNSNSKKYSHLSHLYNLVPMIWDNQNSIDETLPKYLIVPWMPESDKPATTNLTGLLPNMAKLRSETTPIYVKAVLKNEEPMANSDIRYTGNDMIVIERWYPRRNTYVFVANFGMRTQTKDLSSLYYGGHVVVGPEHKLNRNIYFKELIIPPGEAFIIKLDK
ncbi:PREDICTED: neutral and basic amino acid transport protein rBAT-like [Ceratosolen solmsi marchali]|uniref:Neutral and basic amino acid transport protein rBAT-like n=1 Tax=Ceratosolen solmsi marchali TaxID=326594 RepID=A0AAJ7DXJ2_9HYME|nr:PREDICTED: neutral and basic amino acid transport protein rBAT-like [Ceratosolen solmsi marchali]